MQVVRLETAQCQPCYSKTEVLTIHKIEEYLTQIPGWQLDTSKQDSPRLRRTFTGKDFNHCVDMVCKIRNVAQKENHHPEIHLTSFNRLEVVIQTFAVNNLTINDFILAAKITTCLST
ncbi:4a-hydroxytetrahydrobiopterin dehydratase [Galdieria sulphuraria]|uniref:4a-hydroxytetrahydrobiopterin dehydratase n=1 Tax=Galdieria sulphuraria TaxID=130081 RepID=M2Y6X6_GALSU|nr:4a-hydroxytetrahydrobiopterin dehydratase [Galdieria sulphuraria]EME31604.1 4a-hydroxytetrahydrobiopterin dehydratase [Galdieria sulphuraria]|eukprot:XP_005708124.1 4a-hydroxytetrahydrobiopterin dehydratase [Galdieria sulphuraria]